jgi:ABC-type bacteriocin/lantibiotic exporter with double-glycine peptidase domain
MGLEFGVWTREREIALLATGLATGLGLFGSVSGSVPVRIMADSTAGNINSTSRAVNSNSRRLSSHIFIEWIQFKMKESLSDSKDGWIYGSSKESTAPMSSLSDLFSFIDSRKSKFFFLLGTIGGILNGLVYPAIAYIFSNSFSSLSSTSMHAIRIMGLRFVGIGAYAFIVGSIQNISFEITGKMAMSSFRLKWFKALLRQDAAFYDVYSVSGYATSMGANAKLIDRGLGAKFGEGIQYIVTGFGGIAFALWQSWRVGLVILAVLPLLSISALAVMKINQNQTASATKAYAK